MDAGADESRDRESFGNPMISNLEAVLSGLMLVALVSALAGFDAVSLVSGVLLGLGVVVFLGRTAVRRSRGASWDDALGRRPR